MLNEGRGLGDLSEEALEANNKYVRRYLELLSRKASLNQQLEDVMGRLLERSDPFVLDRKLNFRPIKKVAVIGSVAPFWTKNYRPVCDKITFYFTPI